MPSSSTEHPFIIDTVRSPAGGLIGMAACPGLRRGGEAASPESVATDLQVIQAWGAKDILTLMEIGEMDRLGASSIGYQARALGIHWHHLPIADFSAPGETFSESWPAIQAQLTTTLGANGRVLIHCRAGLGRTGTLAARLLVDGGMAADDAITVVRANRAGTIETQEQLAFIQRP